MKVLSIFVLLAVSALALESSFLPNANTDALNPIQNHNLPSVNADPLNPVQNFNLSAYQGTWYEIASFSYAYVSGCYCTTATYTLNSDNTLKVKNYCNWGSPTGLAINLPGTLAPQDPINGTITTGKLDIQFLGYNLAPYYIIDVDPVNYQWAVVGTPNRDYYFILSRNNTIDSDLYNQLLQNATAEEFNITRVKQVYQGAGCPNQTTTLDY